MPTATQTPSVLDSLITAKDLAQRLRVSENTLAKWRVQGRGPQFLRVGRQALYTPDKVDAWLLEQEHKSTLEEWR